MKATRFVIYIDGGSRGNPGPGACAAAVFDSAGGLLAEEGRYLGRCTNNFAEYNGFSLALSAARRLGARELKVFSDSELLVKQYQGEYKIKDPVLRGLMAEIKKAAAGFSKITLSHIPRGRNSHADGLVNKILDNSAGLGAELDRSLARENGKKLHQPELWRR